ncbi:Alpha/Beta hydrolase protein [Plectosphaerella plurivora]|uniref:Alpha/Beta hydrolase protein n=1 Tax=Plectosphaerella plurivora TaxID=936078 RepID=A0A9P9AGP4_9PEZI|nr:Alpha/Beta hydrolase protein [Plectosphaerella plurivora]
MCDFSQYGGASEEWLAAEKTITISSATEGISVTEKKRLMNESREQASKRVMKTRFKGLVTTRDHVIVTRDGGTIEARSYHPKSAADQKLPVFLYFHGGGFLMGSLDTEDATCAGIATGAGVVVLHVDYRHTPEHPYPVAWNDAEDGFAWLHDHIEDIGGIADKVVVGGISAGAQLTASLVLQQHLKAGNLSDFPTVAGQVLMIPCLAHMDAYQKQLDKMRDPSVSSYKENADAPLLNVKTIRMFLDLLQVQNPDVLDLRLGPGNADPEQVKGLPPAIFGIAGLDPLRDEGLLYAKMLAEAGVPTDTYVFEGVPHAFRRFGELSQSKRWDAVMVRGIQWCLSRPRATPFSVKTTGPEL